MSKVQYEALIEVCKIEEPEVLVAALTLIEDSPQLEAVDEESVPTLRVPT